MSLRRAWSMRLAGVDQPAGRSLLRRALVWALIGAATRSRRPTRLLARPLPGLSSAACTVPMTVVSLFVSEFPMHTLVAQVASTMRSLGHGALRGPRGRIGLLVACLSWIPLLATYRDGRRADEVLDASLRAAVGGDYRSQLPVDPSSESPRTLRDFWFPRFTERRRYLQHEDLPYGTLGKRNHLDVWRRQDLPLGGRAPVLIQIHGSAWTKGSKRGQGYPLMAHMAQRGWVCVTVNYSLAPAAHWPAHIIDVKRAIGWVKREIAHYGGDPDFIVVTGGSAGGHLSALAALTANDPVFQPGFEDVDTSVQAAVPLYGVYDLLDRAGDSPPEQEGFLARIVIGASRYDAFDIWNQGSPLSQVHSDAPPFFVIHGSIDTSTNHEQARAFANSLRHVSRNPVAYTELTGAQHCFDLLPSVRTAATVRAIDRFLTLVRKQHNERVSEADLAAPHLSDPHPSCATTGTA